MKSGTTSAVLVVTAFLAACGGGATDSGAPNMRPLAQAMASDGNTIFSGNRAGYTITRTATGYSVSDNAGGEGTSVTASVQTLRFADASVNLGIGDKAASIATADLKTLIELYVAFFNRIPDADGLAYWIDQFKAGQSVAQIADSFHAAAVQYGSLTGYAASMSDADFVRVVYRNVLGRTGATAPPDADVLYWAGELGSGRASKGSLITTMLASARSFAGDATWGWVPQLLDNKYVVAHYFSVQQGLGYLSAEETISRTMAIAAAVTSSGTLAASDLIGIADAGFDLAATGGTIQGPAYIAACPTDIATPLFGTVPIDVNDFIAFRPLGFMSTPIHMFPAKHSAFSMTAIGQTPVAKPVRAPGTVIVSEIYEASFSTGGRNYQVFMHPCREVRVYFGHIASLSDRLMAEFNNGTPKCNSFNDGSATVTTCRRENLSLQLEEGEQFGTGPDTSGVDFGTLDFRRAPAAFVNRSHYDAYYPYYTSPLDYFSAASKLAIESKTGNVFGGMLRTALPIGGTYMQDIRGTAQGNWFLPGRYHSNSTDLSGFLGLAHDYADPAQPLMAMGTSIVGMSLGLYSFTVQTTGQVNRDFGDIKSDGKIYCFDNFLQGQSAGSLPVNRPNGVVLMTLPNDISLKVELVAGSTCETLANWVFSANATVFER